MHVPSEPSRERTARVPSVPLLQRPPSSKPRVRPGCGTSSVRTPYKRLRPFERHDRHASEGTYRRWVPSRTVRVQLVRPTSRKSGASATGMPELAERRTASIRQYVSTPSSRSG